MKKFSQLQKSSQAYRAETQPFTKKLIKLLENVNESILTTNYPVDISEIRSELSTRNRSLFEVNEEADSMEAYHKILEILHQESEYSNTSLNECNCLSHSVFGILTNETYTCSCGESLVLYEDLFSQNIFINDYLKPSDRLFKVNVGLGLLSDQEIESQSQLFKLAPFEDFLQHQIYKKSEELKCRKCSSSFQESIIKLRRIPEVYTIQLIWAVRNPNKDKILKALKSISHHLNLQDLGITDTPTNHMLKGMIVRLSNHYIYVVRCGPPNFEWVIINDSCAKVFYTGNYADLPHFFLTTNAYPVGLFYQQSDSDFDRTPEDIYTWIVYEKAICKQEIYKLEMLSFENFEWRCFYCKCQNMNNRDDHCSLCNSVRVLTLNDWKCDVCAVVNEYNDTICNYCLNKRFWKDGILNNIYGDNLRNLRQAIEGRLISNCLLCKRDIILGMSAFCMCCNSTAHILGCECDLLDSEIVCIFCYKKVVKCFNCSRMIISSDSVCRHCGISLKNKIKCIKCKWLNEKEICDACQIINQVTCVICNEKVSNEICFICPICDNEFDDGYCKICDYEVDFKKFVCGKCRNKAKRCFVCEAGLILKNDENCHFCKSNIINLD